MTTRLAAIVKDTTAIHYPMKKASDRLVQNTLGILLVVFLVTFVSSVYSDQEEDLIKLKNAFTQFEDSYRQGHFLISLPEAKTAYQLGKQLFGLKSPETAKLTYNYGNNLLRLHHYAEADSTLTEALNVFEQVYGTHSIELVPVLMDLGHVKANRNQDRNKRKLYERAFELIEQSYGSKSVEFGWFSVKSGVDVMKLAHDKQGAAYIKNGYEILRSDLGDNDPRVGFAAYNLGSYELSVGNYKASKQHLLDALVTFEQPDKPSNKMELSTHAYLVRVYEELGESESATRHSLAIGRMTPFESAQDYFPLYKRPPVYPKQALRNRKESLVVVQFTVDENGFVQDPKIVMSTGGKIFEQPSLEAVKKFRYAPRFVNGKAVQVMGVQNKFTYSINN